MNTVECAVCEKDIDRANDMFNKFNKNIPVLSGEFTIAEISIKAHLPTGPSAGQVYGLCSNCMIDTIKGRINNDG